MFKNLHELIAKMPTDADCRKYLADQRWPDGKVTCPYCDHYKCYTLGTGKHYKCASKTCLRKFTVTVGTFLEDSNIGLNKWLMAIYLCTAHKKGISSYQLAKDLGITQKSGWFMLHRIRAIMEDKQLELLSGTVEADETYMGRKYRSDYVGLSEAEIDYKMKTRDSKGAVLGLVERETGKVRVKVFPKIERDEVTSYVMDNVLVGSKLHTDESSLYRKLEYSGYYRESVVHSRREWVRKSISAGKVHCNGVEAFWGVMKRGLHGIYHQVSYKHLNRYCSEFSFRYNNRDLKDYERFNLVLEDITGRLDYPTLTGKKK